MRLKELRVKLGLTQQAFADKLNLSKSTIESYEYKRREIPERTLDDISKTFSVNKEWLKTGIGDMFYPYTRDQQIASFIGSIQCEDNFKSRFISMLSKLNEEEWNTLEHMAELLLKEKDQVL